MTFANSSGGQSLIGVHDNGDIKGVKFPEDNIYLLNKYIDDHIAPQLDYSIDEIIVDNDKTVIIYNIPKSNRRPHYVRGLSNEKPQTYVRYKDKSIKASAEVREILKRTRKNKDIRFNFGEKEKQLIAYLDKNGSITIDDFQKLSNINFKLVSRTLILLVLANVLDIQPTDKGDFYRLKKVNKKRYSSFAL